MSNEQEVNAPEIHLLITRAEIRQVNLWEDRIQVQIALMCNSKELTTVTLDNGSWMEKDNPKWINYTEAMRVHKDSLFKLAKKHANISLERLQAAIPESASKAEVVP